MSTLLEAIRKAGAPVVGVEGGDKKPEDLRMTKKLRRGNVDRLPPCIWARPGKKIRQTCRKVKQFWRCTHKLGVKGQDLTRKHCEMFCKYRNKA